MTRNLIALSLNAFWNWVTIRLQKPRRQPRFLPEVDSAGCGGSEAVSLFTLRGAPPQTNIFWGVEQIQPFPQLRRSNLVAQRVYRARKDLCCNGNIHML